MVVAGGQLLVAGPVDRIVHEDRPKKPCAIDEDPGGDGSTNSEIRTFKMSRDGLPCLPTLGLE